MPQQLSFGDAEHDVIRQMNGKRHVTRRDQFLSKLDKIVPWADLAAGIRPFYYKGVHGRPPVSLERMLRIHICQIAHNLSDPGMEDALYDSLSFRKFVGLTCDDPVPDETTILNFRHLLEEHDLGKKIFDIVNDQAEIQNLMLRKGTIVDATFIDAPSSTKNKTHSRDPEMKSGKKAETWHFGMKMHAGVDRDTGLVHTISVTPANESDVVHGSDVLTGEEEEVYGDAGYLGMANRIETATGSKPKARFHISARPSTYRDLRDDHPLKQLQKLNSGVRSKVEHVFHRIKIQMKYRMARYRGLAKNTNRLLTLCGLANLLTFACLKARLKGAV